MPGSGDGAETPEVDSLVGAERQARLEALRVASQEWRDAQETSARPVPIDWNSSEGQQHLEWLMGHAGVPLLYRQGLWEKCRAKDALLDYARRLPEFVENGRGLLILGPVGTGKSTAAGLIVRAAVKQNIGCRWEYAADVKDRLGQRQGRDQWLRISSTIPLLVWDDFGVGGLVDWEIGLLDRIVERRYQKSKPMVVTSNMTREALLADELARMVDRWSERGFTVRIEGESMRRTWRDG